MGKKIAVGLGGLLALVLIIGMFVWSNLDSLVKAAVEQYGSEAAQTKVSLASVELSPTSGAGKLIGLRVKNPKGFETDEAFFLGMIDVQVDMDSVAGDGPIIINKVVIDKPQMTFEVNEKGTSNMQQIAGHAKNYARTSGSKIKSNKKKEVSEPKEEGRKIIIKMLKVSGGKVAVSHSLMKGKKIEAEIPTFTMRNLGQREKGLSSAELASKLIGTISQKASAAASQSFIKGFDFFSK